LTNNNPFPIHWPSESKFLSFFPIHWPSESKFLSFIILKLRLIRIDNADENRVYSNIENLVLWARSEITGFAVSVSRGVLEYWNIGIMGLAE